MQNKYKINGQGVHFKNLWEASSNPQTKFELDADARRNVSASRKYIDSRLSKGEVMYGVNTGFGAFSSVRISDAEIELLQRNLIRSHSMGVGVPFSRQQTRAMMILRANALSRGHSGCRPEVIDKILEFLNHDIIPAIPSQGSVGASGDLAPLSHLALALIGEGMVWADDDQFVPVSKVLQKKQLKPLVLKHKEGLSLINGCQVMTAVGLLTLHQAHDLLLLADLAGAMSLEGLRGSRNAFDPLISASHAHAGEIQTAKNLRLILGAKSEISESHKDCNKVQDAYSLRCMPAVHGAAKETFHHVKKVLETEANSSTDNPLVFAEDEKILSCGNFHGEPVAFALDFLAIALSSTASISECRIAKMINPAMSDLPAFLAPNGGLNSGHMIVQVAAASLVSENKILSHPASVDSIPTSAEKEDHVSMGTIASRKAYQILQNAQNVIAMEFLSATQALDMVGKMKSSKAIEKIRSHIREEVPFAKEDRIFSEDVQKIRGMMLNGELLQTLQAELKEIGV